MHIDVSELREFYTRPLGQTVRRLLAHRIRARWRRVEGETVIGLGFATPYLAVFQGEAGRIGALMPAEQGALVWPRPGKGATATVLVDETRLPLPDNSVDRLLAVHCLENADSTRPLLREMWRVMAPEGRLLIVVPNRRGIWARLEWTPFGQGRPFSRGQLERLLKEALFSPIDVGWALHLPPLDRRLVLRSAATCERLGSRLAAGLGGVVIMEARKELVAPPRGKVARTRASVLSGLVTVRPASGGRRDGDGNREG